MSFVGLNLVSGTKFKSSAYYFRCDNCSKVFVSFYKRDLKKRDHFCNDECFSLAIEKKNVGGDLSSAFVSAQLIHREASVEPDSKSNICQFCNVPYKRINNFQKFCSDECFQKHRKIYLDNRRKKREESAPIRNCKFCNGEYKRYRERHGFCSRSCASKFYIQNGTYDKWLSNENNQQSVISKSENRFHKKLIKIYGQENIKRQQPLFIKKVDFHILSLDLYIEFDGAYWHGLNRPLEQIINSPLEVDKGIYRNYLQDRELDKLCLENDKLLIRITDKEVINKKKIESIKLILDSRIEEKKRLLAEKWDGERKI